MKKITLAGIIILASFSLFAQYTLPPSVLKAIPQKYTITYQMFVNQGDMARGEITLEIPAKNSCNDDILGVCEIRVKITSYGESAKGIVAIYEKQLPFKNRLPKASNYTPTIDPFNEMVTYSETKEILLEGGSAAYFMEKNSCVMDQHSEFESVSLKSLQGNTAKSIEISVVGGISAEDAIAIVKELYKILYSINYHA